MTKLLCEFVLFLAAMCTIVSAQESASINVPDIAMAGETVNLDITLDKAPNFDGGAVLIWITGPGNFPIQSSCQVKSGEKTCRWSLHLPPDAPGGTWYVSKLAFYAGTHPTDLPFEKLPFQVIAKSGLVFPSRAEVVVSPSQVQLFRREATRLQAQLQSLKAAVADIQGASSQVTLGTLRRHVQDEIGSLRATESKFHELRELKAQGDAAEVFFDDLRTSYEEVLVALRPEKSNSETKATVLAAAWRSSSSASLKKNKATYTLSALAVFRAVEQNELAYTLVADTGTLTFDLEISSLPEGAAVSYRRRGDPYKGHPNPTNSVIKALPYAIWIVRLQKPGFRDQEVEHNPFTDRNPNVTVELNKP